MRWEEPRAGVRAAFRLKRRDKRSDRGRASPSRTALLAGQLGDRVSARPRGLASCYPCGNADRPTRR